MSLRLSVGKAAQHYGVHPQTIREWTDAGKIQFEWTPTRQRRIIIHKSRSTNQEQPNKIKAAYCRVSSQEQKDDLQRQVQSIQERFPEHKVFKDIGSGINFQRKNFLALLDAALQGMVEEIVVSSKDRLCRFAFELYEWLLTRQGTRLVILEQNDLSPECELSNDVLSIIQVFCCRRNGSRRYNSKSTQGEVEPDKKTKETTEKLGSGVQVHVQ